MIARDLQTRDDFDVTFRKQLGAVVLALASTVKNEVNGVLRESATALAAARRQSTASRQTQPLFSIQQSDDTGEATLRVQTAGPRGPRALLASLLFRCVSGAGDRGAVGRWRPSPPPPPPPRGGGLKRRDANDL